VDTRAEEGPDEVIIGSDELEKEDLNSFVFDPGGPFFVQFFEAKQEYIRLTHTCWARNELAMLEFVT
jgi:hypothetical protein